MIFWVILLSMFSPSIYGSDTITNLIEIDKRSVQYSSELGKLTLLMTENDGFFIEKNGCFYPIRSRNMDKLSSELSFEAAQKFQENGYFKIVELSNGEFKLSAHSQLRGGGPLFAIGMAIGLPYLMFGNEVTVPVVERADPSDIMKATVFMTILAFIAPTP